MGDDEAALGNKAKSLNVNYMPWLVKEKMLLIYRHMLPKEGYKYGVDSVATLNKSKPAKGQEGSVFIGEYSPLGALIPKAQLLKSTRIDEMLQGAFVGGHSGTGVTSKYSVADAMNL